ncbi:MAG: hypothetical protein ACOX60_11855 [Massiliimalia sp.]|jgi:hypothetical protein
MASKPRYIKLKISRMNSKDPQCLEPVWEGNWVYWKDQDGVWRGKMERQESAPDTA